MKTILHSFNSNVEKSLVKGNQGIQYETKEKATDFPKKLEMTVDKKRKRKFKVSCAKKAVDIPIEKDFPSEEKRCSVVRI